jgi:hypothetical protein
MTLFPTVITMTKMFYSRHAAENLTEPSNRHRREDLFP